MKRRGKFQQKTDEQSQQKEFLEAATHKEETKEERDESHFSKQIETVERIINLNNSGYSVISMQWKLMIAPTYILEVLKLGKEGMKEYWRKLYGNPNLGKKEESNSLFSFE